MAKKRSDGKMYNPPMGWGYLTTTEIAYFCGYKNVSSLLHAIGERDENGQRVGRLKASMRGNTWFIRPSDYNEFIRQKKTHRSVGREIPLMGNGAINWTELFSAIDEEAATRSDKPINPFIDPRYRDDNGDPIQG